MSDAYSVIYSPEAKSDIKDIYSYIAFELLVPRTAESHRLQGYFSGAAGFGAMLRVGSNDQLCSGSTVIDIAALS